MLSTCLGAWQIAENTCEATLSVEEVGEAGTPGRNVRLCSASDAR